MDKWLGHPTWKLAILSSSHVLTNGWNCSWYWNPGLYIRAGSRRSSPASLPGFAGYFHCFTSLNISRRWTHNRLLFTKLQLLKNLKKMLCNHKIYTIKLLGRSCTQLTALPPANWDSYPRCFVHLRCLFHWHWKASAGSSRWSMHIHLYEKNNMTKGSSNARL